MSFDDLCNKKCDHIIYKKLYDKVSGGVTIDSVSILFFAPPPLNKIPEDQYLARSNIILSFYPLSLSISPRHIANTNIVILR